MIPFINDEFSISHMKRTKPLSKQIRFTKRNFLCMFTIFVSFFLTLIFVLVKMLFNSSNLNSKYNDLLHKYAFQTEELEKANDEIEKLMSTIQELRNKVEHLNDQINFVGYDRDF